MENCEEDSTVSGLLSTQLICPPNYMFMLFSVFCQAKRELTQKQNVNLSNRLH